MTTLCVGVFLIFTMIVCQFFWNCFDSRERLRILQRDLTAISELLHEIQANTKGFRSVMAEYENNQRKRNRMRE